MTGPHLQTNCPGRCGRRRRWGVFARGAAALAANARQVQYAACKAGLGHIRMSDSVGEWSAVPR
jgi:hypothetical protein